jgi:hypothetical protein
MSLFNVKFGYVLLWIIPIPPTLQNLQEINLAVDTCTQSEFLEFPWAGILIQRYQPGKGNKMIQNYITCIYVCRFQNMSNKNKGVHICFSKLSIQVKVIMHCHVNAYNHCCLHIHITNDKGILMVHHFQTKIWRTYKQARI